MSPDPFNATLVERTDLTESLSIVRLQPDSGQAPAFIPGQFCTLGLPPASPPPVTAPQRPGQENRVRLVRRAYSIASPPREKRWLELIIVLVSEGKLTPNLWTVEKGGRLFLDPRINGQFTLDPIPTDKTLVMIATGTGVAPFRSMIQEYKGTGRWRKLVLFHGVRGECDLGYRSEFETLAATDPTIIYVPILSRQPDDSKWTGLRGRVTICLEKDIYENAVGEPLDPKLSHVLLCGNPAMIAAVQENLEPRGFVYHSPKEKHGNLHYERYW